MQKSDRVNVPMSGSSAITSSEFETIFSSCCTKNINELTHFQKIKTETEQKLFSRAAFKKEICKCSKPFMHKETISNFFLWLDRQFSRLKYFKLSTPDALKVYEGFKFWT